MEALIRNEYRQITLMCWPTANVLSTPARRCGICSSFTDRRILNVDKKGITGSKKDYLSVPFAKVGSFAVEFGGKLAGLVTVRLWTSGAEPVEVVFHKSANGEGIQKVLVTQILQRQAKRIIPLGIRTPQVVAPASLEPYRTACFGGRHPAPLRASRTQSPGPRYREPRAPGNRSRYQLPASRKPLRRSPPPAALLKP